MLDKTYAIVGVTCAVIGAAGYALRGDAVKDEVTLNLPGALSSKRWPLHHRQSTAFHPTRDDGSGGKGARVADGRASTPRTATGPSRRGSCARGSDWERWRRGEGDPVSPRVRFAKYSRSSPHRGSAGILPGRACYLKMFEDELDEGEMAINWIIMFVGGFCVVAGSVSALEQITNAAS